MEEVLPVPQLIGISHNKQTPAQEMFKIFIIIFLFKRECLFAYDFVWLVIYLGYTKVSSIAT